MKRSIVVVATLILLCFAISAQAEVPQLSGNLYDCAKQALVYLSSGEYERLVTLLPFSDVAPSASEWEGFAKGNFATLGAGVQTDYSVAYWTGSNWNLAVPVVAPDNGSVEALVLTSSDGTAFSGYRYASWSSVESEFSGCDYVIWNKEYINAVPFIAAD